MLWQEITEKGYGELYRGCGPTLQTVALSNFIFFYLAVQTDEMPQRVKHADR